MDKGYLSKKEVISRMVSLCCIGCNNRNGEKCGECLLKALMDDIYAAHTADVAPVVHGRWEFGTTQGRNWMKCSKCLHSQDGWTGVFAYCPNCGAKMDLEVRLEK